MKGYYIVNGILVAIVVLVLVVICVCIMNFSQLLCVFLKSDTKDNPEENTTALQDVQVSTINVKNQKILSSFPSHELPTYQETENRKV